MRDKQPVWDKAYEVLVGKTFGRNGVGSVHLVFLGLQVLQTFHLVDPIVQNRLHGTTL